MVPTAALTDVSAVARSLARNRYATPRTYAPYGTQVTNANREEYVALYCKQIVVTLPGRALNEFVGGFKRVRD